MIQKVDTIQLITKLSVPDGGAVSYVTVKFVLSAVTWLKLLASSVVGVMIQESGFMLSP